MDYIQKHVMQAKSVAIKLGCTFNNDSEEKVFESMLTRIAIVALDGIRTHQHSDIQTLTHNLSHP